MKTLLSQALWQAGLIVLTAFLVGIGINFFHTEKLPLWGGWSPRSLSGDTIPLAQAKELYLSKKAVFVDARPHDLYIQGHIQGAFALPIESFDQYFFDFMKSTSVNSHIITYCDGETCQLSHELSKILKEQGYSQVQVLVNGWTLWQENHLPVEK